MSRVQFFDSLSKSPLPPPEGKKRLSFYACGITPYAPSHIGHARSFVVFDLLRRTLEAHGYQVDMVRNITDIDDKIIAQAQADGVAWNALSWGMADINTTQMAQLGVVDYEQPKASEYIPEMIALVERLLERGRAYVSSTGDVLFDTQAFSGAALRVMDPESLKSAQGQSRVSIEGKKTAADFVLWKPAKEGEPFWPSPWGNGRPGWHLECSAMVQARFDETLDYHGGGIDLCFPHHQAEISQSEGAFDRPLAYRWVHHGAVRDGLGRKMSKSLGNTIGLQEALDQAQALVPGAGGAVLRVALLSSLWTQPLDWADTLLADTARKLKRWSKAAAGDATTPAHDHPVLVALADNLNTPKAFAALDSLAKRAENNDPQAAGLVSEGLRLLGVGPAWQLTLSQDPVIEVPASIQALFQARLAARQARDFQKSDEIRQQLSDAGWVVEDRPAQDSVLKPRG